MLKKEYKIAVVANMSAGKSTFLNAMFGDDILPAYTVATTDCPIYIYSDDNPDNDKAIVEFEDARIPIELSKNIVKKELKFYAKKDSDDLDEKYKNVYRIHLYWDFKKLQNKNSSKFNFIFIDTPGPNNTDIFQEKHSNITKNILSSEADMVLYLFDYVQIDSNLEATKNNLWNMIIQRKKQDKDFEVFFIINKIDKAFDDNKKLFKVKQSKTKDEFYKNLKEFWFYHEDKAIKKITKTAKKYGFENPRIFTASSKYEQLMRMQDISFDDEDEIDRLKELFKNMFGNNWQKELRNYLNINWIEDNTKFHLENIKNDFINTIAK